MYRFRREIEFDTERVVIRDEFQVPPGGTPKPARRTSQRHVASADSFHWEDFRNDEPGCGIVCEENREVRDGVFFAERVYRLAEKKMNLEGKIV